MGRYAFFAYHRKDDNMLEKCISSLRAVCPHVVITITTDGVPDELAQRFDREYNVDWIFVSPKQMLGRRATCKIEVLWDLVRCLTDGTEVLVSDVDVYFLKDPFVPFGEHPYMDLGVTTRGYAHAFPINGGIFYIRVSQEMRNWLRWHLDEIYNPNWPPYVKHRKRWHHERYGLDWSVGQDFLVANWMNKEEVEENLEIKIIDVGPNYNYCPPTDTMGEDAFTLAWKALESEDVVTLHLKSDLKRMIYDPKFPGVELKYEKGLVGWM